MVELFIEGNQLYSAIILYPDLNFLFLIILAIIKKGEKFLTFFESDNTYNLGQTAMFAGGFLAFLLWLAYDLQQPQASEDSSDQGHMESLTQEEGCC